MARRKSRSSFHVDWDAIRAVLVGLMPFPLDSILTYLFLKEGR